MVAHKRLFLFFGHLHGRFDLDLDAVKMAVLFQKIGQFGLRIGRAKKDDRLVVFDLIAQFFIKNRPEAAVPCRGRRARFWRVPPFWLGAKMLIR